MANLQEPEKRKIITRAPFVDESVGEMVAHLRRGMPIIDVSISPLDADDLRLAFDMIPKEARRTAAALLRIADEAEQAAWTPKLLARIRREYLPGKTDEEIIGYLHRLVERDGGLELYEGERLYPDDGHTLTALANREMVERAQAAVSASGLTLSELTAALGDLRQVYRDKSEGLS